MESRRRSKAWSGWCIATGLLVAFPTTLLQQPVRCLLVPGATRAIVLDDSLHWYSETPQAVPTPDGMALFGDPTFAWTRDPVHGRVRLAAPEPGQYLAGVEIPDHGTARRIDNPPGVARLVEPYVLPTGDGGAHVIWGSASDTSRHPVRADTAWYARWSARSGWAERELLGPIETGMWGRNGFVGFAGNGSDLMVAVAALAGTFDRHVALFRRTAAGWMRSTVATPGTPFYVSLAHAGSRTLMAFDGREARRNGNSAVYVTTSDDHGATWGDPVLVGSTYSGRFASPRLQSTGAGWALLWSYAPRGAAPESLLTSVSLDAGTTWVRSSGVVVPGGFAGFQAVTAQTGNIHVVLGGPAGTERLHTVIVWDGMAAAHASASRSISIPTVARLPGQLTRVFWGRLRAAGPDSAPELMTATLREQGCRSTH